MTFRRDAATVSGFVGAAIVMSSPAWSQMTPPPAGAKYTFECSSSVNANYEEVYSILSSDGSTLRVEVDDGIERNWYEKPLYLLNTTIASKQMIRGQESSMFNIPSEFKQLQSLEVGGKYSGYVIERRPRERLEWDYTLSVLGRETVYNRAFGDLKVITLSEARWVNVYSSNLDVRYAPELSFPLSWEYKDSNGAEITCELAAAEGLDGIPVVARPEAPGTVVGSQIAVVKSPQRMRSIVNANVREEPSRAAARIGRLGNGTRISVSGYVDVSGERWYALPLDNGTTGYVFSGVLKEANAPATSPAAAAALAPASKPAVQPAAKPQPAQGATQTAAVRAPAPTPAPAAADTPERLKKLDELRRLDLISEAEYQQKRKDLLGSGKSVGIADQLRQTNAQFRQGKINPEEFVKTRAGILAKINTQDMDAKQGLVLLNDLINERLISEAEYSRKRATMLDAL
ncbi:SH3 domain-containing protein [Denitrobaculum tricleocarpae]|uniref:SH3 domain-containing protein n=1 Tax=Denitrobaculum tricleocarpae TaxID=2591009 RepID=A0A545TT87_9PROT|nr:SH3 domain-containing protein [Denitrobaculum tricleocarpae]TQV80434.1 SH3 domain-containing protein [Denitrobaculum tricleocarpae]